MKRERQQLLMGEESNFRDTKTRLSSYYPHCKSANVSKAAAITSTAAALMLFFNIFLTKFHVLSFRIQSVDAFALNTILCSVLLLVMTFCRSPIIIPIENKLTHGVIGVSVVIILNWSFSLMVTPNTVAQNNFQTIGVMSFLLMVVAFVFAIPSLLSTGRILSLLEYSLTILILFSMSLFILPDLHLGGRFRGIFVDPGVLSNISSLAASIFALRFLIDRRVVHALLFMGALTLIISTGSRTALLQVFSALFFFGLLDRTGPGPVIRGFFKRYYFLCIPVFTVAVTCLFFLGVGRLGFGAREVRNNGFLDRFMHWKTSVSNLKDNVWVGDGILSKFMEGGNGVALTHFHSYKDPHNVFIYMVQVGGLPLLTILMLLLIAVGFSSVRAIGSRNVSLSIIGALMISNFSALLFGGSLFSINNINDKIFWLFLGVLAIHSSQEKIK